MAPRIVGAFQVISTEDSKALMTLCAGCGERRAARSHGDDPIRRRLREGRIASVWVTHRHPNSEVAFSQSRVGWSAVP